MRRFLISCFLIAGGLVAELQAGNPDRAGEAGAYELLINPWVRSNGFNGMNGARVEGVEAMRLNVAGLARVTGTEVLFSRSNWLQGSEVFINAFGLGQKFGKDKQNAFGVSVMSINFGEIERTTNSLPEGGIGFFKPQFLNIGASYSRAFSNSIYGGVLVRMINQRIEDLSANGIALDAGLQYITGKREQIRFGISLRNVGTPMRYTGNGLTFRGQAPGGDFLMSQEMRTEKFELPSTLNISGAYDWWIDHTSEDPQLRLTFLASFVSNSFGKDNFGGGLEFSFKEMFMVRAGYRYEDGLLSETERTNAHTGFAAGASVMVPLKKSGKGPKLGIDYAYRTSNPFKGTHVFGVRFGF